MLDSRDFMYTMERVNDKRTVWRCRSKSQFSCKARATTIDNQIIKFINDHNHDPESQRK